MRRNSKTMKSATTIAVTIIALLMVVACTRDFYETGDSSLSYLNTSFAEVSTNASSAFVEAVTDDGTTLRLTPAYHPKWKVKADTTYRALLYYNKVEDGATAVVAIQPVAVLKMKRTTDVAHMHTDPVTFESAWVSKGHRYLNLGLVLKTGKTDDSTAVQSLGVVCDSVKQQFGGGKKYYIRLYHNQNNVPEYYSTKVFTSIPLADITPQDSVILDINTYKGWVRKRFAP